MRALTFRPSKPPRASFELRLRLGVLFLGAGLLAAGCNRPAEEPPANVLATSVSSTLTAQPVIQPTSTQAVEPPIGGGEIDPSTPEPSATPSETEISPTEEAEVSPTPSNTPFPLEPGDPRSGLNLSDPDYADEFSQRFTWFEFSDPEAATFIGEDDRLKVTDHVTDGILWWTTTALEAESSYTRVVAQTTSCSGKDAYGIGLRVGGENVDRGYTLEISCDGAYRVRKFTAFDEIPAVLRDWTTSKLIQAGPNASNTIGFLANGEQLFAFVNGQLLDTVAVEDSAYTSGVPSLFANASQTPNLTVYFDDFGLWFLPP